MPRKPAQKSVTQRTRKLRAKLTNFKKFKLHKNFVKGLVLVALFSISVLFILGLGFYKKITQNFASASSPNSCSIRDSDIYTLLYMSDDAYYFNFFDTHNKKIISYSLPLNTVLDVPGKYGEEELSKLLALGKLNNENDEMQLVKRGFSKLFGYKVDKYIVSGHKMTLGIDDFYKDIKKTNVSMSDAYYMFSFIKSLPSDGIIKREFSNSIDNDIRDLTFDSRVALERKSVAVLNGTDMSGLASYASRVVMNLGGRVVSAGNSQVPYEETMLIVDDPESETVTEMVQSFNIKKVIRKSQSEINENEIDRADIVLILGLDMQDAL